MKISQIAAATLVPATLAGVVLTAMPFAQAAPAPAPAPVHVTHHAAPAKPAKPAKAVKAATSGTSGTQAKAPRAHAAAAPAAQPAASSTAGSSQVPSNTAQAPAQTQPAAASQPQAAGMSSFEQCVAWRESGNNPTASSAGMFGILPATWASLGYSGTAGQASVAQQEAAFNQLYAQYGTSPWAPYDGC